MRKQRVFWILGALLLAGAGVSEALYLNNKRDLTTSSKAAYDAYREAELNMKRFYAKEARVGYAKALELDPNFAMAMLGLAQLSPERDQKIALVHRAARERDRLTERERYTIDIAKAEADGKPDDAYQAALQLHARYPGAAAARGGSLAMPLLAGKPGDSIKRREDRSPSISTTPRRTTRSGTTGATAARPRRWRSSRNTSSSCPTTQLFDSLVRTSPPPAANEAIENLNCALAIQAQLSPAYAYARASATANVVRVLVEGYSDCLRARLHALRTARKPQSGENAEAGAHR
jgi:hypothetical protein